MVKFIKLINGEEVIATVRHNEDSTVSLQQPVKMAMSRQGIGMVPWLPFVKENEPIKLNLSNIMFMTEAEQEIVNAYNSQFGTGIIVADSSILTQ